MVSPCVQTYEKVGRNAVLRAGDVCRPVEPSRLSVRTVAVTGKTGTGTVFHVTASVCERSSEPSLENTPPFSLRSAYFPYFCTRQSAASSRSCAEGRRLNLAVHPEIRYHYAGFSLPECFRIRLQHLYHEKLSPKSDP